MLVIGSARRLQKARRYREVAEVLLRHGLGFLIDDIGIGRLVPWPLRWRGLFLRFQAGDRRLFGTRLRAALCELGPAFIKLGQVLSLRPDLVSPEIVEALRGLQADAAAITLKAVEDEVERALGLPLDRVFSEFSHAPLAVASVAQVHAARLRDGADVVVKVQRPNVLSTLTGDLDILATLAEAGREAWQSAGIDLTDVVMELRRLIRQETDFRLEARATERLRDNFRGWGRVVVPKVYREFSGRTVLTMERLTGLSAGEVRLCQGDRAARRAAGILLRAFLKQVLADGFFHADPHPGNILWTPDGRVAFLDCGAVGRLEQETRRRLYRLLAAFVAQDSARLARALRGLGITPPGGEDGAFQDDVRLLFDAYRDLPADGFELGAAVTDLMALAQRHGVKLPRDLVLLSRALLTLEGVVRDLAPSLNVVQAARPWLARFAARQADPRQAFRRVGTLVAEYADVVEDLPVRLDRVLNALERLDAPGGVKARQPAPTPVSRPRWREREQVKKRASPPEGDGDGDGQRWFGGAQVAVSVVIGAWTVASAALILEGVRLANWTTAMLGGAGFALGGLALGVAMAVFLRPR